MRFLLAGAALVLSSIGLAEYVRRHPQAHEASSAEPEKPVISPGVQALLETAPADPDVPGDRQTYAGLLTKGEGAAVGGFAPVLSGAVSARDLRGGFGAVLFVVDAAGGSAIIRAESGEAPKVVAARTRHINDMQVDGSTVFFSEGGQVLSVSARGDEAPTVRVSFAASLVTSLAAVGDTVYVALRKGVADEDCVIARVDSGGQVTLIASGQVRPRELVADGKEVFWVAGSTPSLWRASADASFSSRIAEEVEGPVALDGDGVVLMHDGALQRVGRAGGKAVVLAKAHVQSVSASSGLVRYLTTEGVFEVSAGSAATRLAEAPGAPLGVALGGTSLYVLFKTASGVVLLSK